MRRFPLILLMVLAAPAWTARADDPKPADSPVKAKLVAKTTTYALDLDGAKPDDFRQLLKDADKSGKFPKAPAVELSLELTNTGDKDVQIWTAGDATRLDLDLKGAGATTVIARKAFTREFRGPKTIILAAGKTETIPITSLTFGFRGVEKQAYWTEAGDYTLGATFVTAVSPAPKGSTDAGDGFGKVTLTAEPIKIKVEEK